MLLHVGFCTVNGYGITTPYIIKDLCDMVYEVFPPTLPEHNTLPASINMDFTGEEDEQILATTKDYGYWWKTQPEDGNPPKVSSGLIRDHFDDYFRTVSG